jgi:hypothetical protein
VSMFGRKGRTDGREGGGGTFRLYDMLKTCDENQGLNGQEYEKRGCVIGGAG